MNSLPTLCGIANNLDITPEEVKSIISSMIISSKNQVGATATDAEVALVAAICHSYGLNPMTRECHAFVGRSGLQVVIGVDGWIKVMNRHPDYDGIELIENFDQHNKLVSVSCKIYKKNTKYPVYITEYMDENFVSTSEVWRKRPKRMLRNKALSQCVRIAFGLSDLGDIEEARESQQERDITPQDFDINHNNNEDKKPANINTIFDAEQVDVEDAIIHKDTSKQNDIN